MTTTVQPTIRRHLGRARFGRCGLIDIMGRLTDEHILADDPTRRCRRKVILTHMQDIGPGERRDVGAVVDGEQGTA